MTSENFDGLSVTSCSSLVLNGTRLNSVELGHLGVDGTRLQHVLGGNLQSANLVSNYWRRLKFCSLVNIDVSRLR